MPSLTYFALLEPEENGGYGIEFPDLPGCFSCCDDLSEAEKMASEAASLHVYGLENDHEPVPAPSSSFPPETTAGRIVMLVTIYPEAYCLKRDNERVKTTITLPAWLKRIAEEENINFSRLLETALLDKLKIQSIH